MSISVENMRSEEDEQRILEYFEKLEWVGKITVNLPDRNVIVSGDTASFDRVAGIMAQLGYVAS